jgi:hypothetical protein
MRLWAVWGSHEGTRVGSMSQRSSANHNSQLGWESQVDLKSFAWVL